MRDLGKNLRHYFTKKSIYQVHASTAALPGLNLFDSAPKSLIELTFALLMQHQTKDQSKPSALKTPSLAKSSEKPHLSLSRCDMHTEVLPGCLRGTELPRYCHQLPEPKLKCPEPWSHEPAQSARCAPVTLNVLQFGAE